MAGWFEMLYYSYPSPYPCLYLGKLWRLGPSSAILSRLGTILGRLGAILGRLGATQGPPGPSWARLEGVLGRLGGVLGRLGASCGRLGSILCQIFNPKGVKSRHAILDPIFQLIFGGSCFRKSIPEF